MSKIVAVTACPTGIAHTIMAAEALKKTGAVHGARHHCGNPRLGRREKRPLRPGHRLGRGGDHRLRHRPGHAPLHAANRSTPSPPAKRSATPGPLSKRRCPQRQKRRQPNLPPQAPARRQVPCRHHLVSDRHRPYFHGRRSLEKAATILGHAIKVETQGSVGTQDPLSEEEIARAEAVIIAADAHVDTSRFGGKKVYETSTKAALNDGQGVVQAALAMAPPEAVAGASYTNKIKQLKKTRSATRTGPYKHLMTGVSYMLPLVVAGGLLIALAFAFGGIYAGKATGTFGWALMQIGGATAFALYVPMLAAFIAFSIADRPGIAPGLVGGMLATTSGSGFLGGIVAGFIAGYLTNFLNDKIQLPENLAGPETGVDPAVSLHGAVGLIMIYLVGPPVKAALHVLTTWLSTMQQSSAAAPRSAPRRHDGL